MCTKLQTVKRKAGLWMIAGILSITRVSAQSASDVALIGAITANTVGISAEMTATNKLQTTILGENAVISTLLNDIYNYEKKMYDYMSKAQNVVTSAYSIGKCLKMGTDIVDELNECRKEATDHPEGLIVSSLITDQYTDIISESAALVSYLTPIVKGSGKDNLLNSAERIRILNTVQSRLYSILYGVKNMKLNIRRMKYCHLARELTPDFYYMFNDTKSAYDVALQQLNKAKTKL